MRAEGVGHALEAELSIYSSEWRQFRGRAGWGR